MYPPASRVGAWLATHELLAELHRRGHQVEVYRRCSGSRAYVLDGIQVHPGRSWPTLETAIRSADVVVSHLGDDGAGAYLARQHRVPSVRMVHGHDPKAAEKLEGDSLAVFNSTQLAAEVAWSGPQIVVHPPVRRDTHATPGELVTVVNLSPAKGGELFWRLAKKSPQQKFLAVRGGWGLQIVFRRQNVTVLRPTLHMNRVYARTRVLLMPSSIESWGMVGVEAMACGIPVVAHPTPGLRESLGDAGIFCDRDDETAWLAALERLRDPAEWEAASRRAVCRAATLAAEDGRAVFAASIGGLTKGATSGIESDEGEPITVREGSEERIRQSRRRREVEVCR